MPDIDPAANTVASALAAAEKPAQVLDHAADDHVLVVATRDAIDVTYEDLERYLPEPKRARGTVRAHTADGFCVAYRTRTVEDATVGAVAYADPDTCRLVAVLNDDYGAHPGWRDHRIELDLQPTPEWTHWTSHQGLGHQEVFAAAIEDGEMEIRDPSATVMLDIAQTFHATTTAKVKQHGRIKDGRTQLVYDEDIDASAGEGRVAIPDTFVIEVRPFYGAEPRTITCRLRYRLDRGILAIGYLIPRADEIRRDAFANDVLGYIRDELPDAVIVEGVPADSTPAGR